MKIKTIWTVIYSIAIAALGFSLLAEKLNAQTTMKVTTQDSLDLAIDDQARYLQDLESRSASQWSFSTDNTAETLENYELSTSRSDVRLTEQKPPEWRNTGHAPNYSVLVDVYDFTEETTEN